MNVGTKINGRLYNDVYQALKSACKHPADQTCGANMKGKFGVFVPKDDIIAKEEMYVTVDSARWNGNKAIYNLLIGAVAGAAERGTWYPGNCHAFKSKDGGGYTFCSTVSRVAVSFPGDSYMNVTFRSSSAQDGFDCWKIRETAAVYLEGLKREIEDAVGGDYFYVDDACVD